MNWDGQESLKGADRRGLWASCTGGAGNVGGVGSEGGIWRNLCAFKKESCLMQTALPSLGMHMFGVSLYHLFGLLLSIQQTLFSCVEH